MALYVCVDARVVVETEALDDPVEHFVVIRSYVGHRFVECNVKGLPPIHGVIKGDRRQNGEFSGAVSAHEDAEIARAESAF